jgi:CheY-like chemotaxis protein
MKKILLVDDSKFLRLATERALARAGYEVSTATDGEQAIELAGIEHPDLILLDLLLPKIPGPEVLKSLKKDPKTADIPVVVFSGLSQKNAARLQHDGAFGYLEKTELGLDKSCEGLITAIRNFIQQLPARKPESGGSSKKAPETGTAPGKTGAKAAKSGLTAANATRT